MSTRVIVCGDNLDVRTEEQAYEKVPLEDCYGRIIALIPKGCNLDYAVDNRFYHEGIYKLKDGYAYIKWYIKNDVQPIVKLLNEKEAFQCMLKHSQYWMAEKYFPNEFEQLNDVVEL